MERPDVARKMLVALSRPGKVYGVPSRQSLIEPGVISIFRNYEVPVEGFVAGQELLAGDHIDDMEIIDFDPAKDEDQLDLLYLWK